MTSAKALGCGVPVGAFAAVKEVADAMCPGDHGTLMVEILLQLQQYVRFLRYLKKTAYLTM